MAALIGRQHATATGEMPGLFRATHWSKTGLGPKDRWPRSLLTLTETLLAHPIPMILLWGPDLIQLYNDGYRLVAGGKHPAALGQPTRDCWPEVWHINAPIYDRVLQRGESILLEDALFPVSRGGAVEDLFFRVSYGPVYDDQAQIAGVLLTVVDTTAKVLAETERNQLISILSNERTRLERVIEQAPAFICTLSGPQHIFEITNERYLKFIGKRDIVGRTVRDVLPEVEGQGFFELLDNVYRTGETFAGTEMPALLRRGGGEKLERCYMNLVYQALRDPGGAISGIFVHGIDVTEMVESRQMIRKALDEADLANKAKDKFLAVLSHELRTPLTPVALIAASMEIDPRLPAEFKDDVVLMRRNLDLETRLIDDLMDLSRVTSGKLSLDLRKVGVHSIIAHALGTVEADLQEKNLSVEVNLAASNDRIDGDAARLQQALWNLLKNAVKFTPAGGRVSILTRNSGDKLILEVRDTGRGISADILPRVFEPFEQGGPDITQRYGGMGLGLAIAKSVVGMHRGTITAASAGEGNGTAFTITLPLPEAASVTPPQIGRLKPDDSLQSFKLLLVEDHEDTGRILARLLRHAGYQVRWANSVANALSMAAAETFDLIVSDLGLPDGTGHDLMRQIIQRHELPGIAMSGFGMEEDLIQSRAAGFAEHLIKPVSLMQLKDAIDRVAGSVIRFKPKMSTRPD